MAEGQGPGCCDSGDRYVTWRDPETYGDEGGWAIVAEGGHSMPILKVTYCPFCGGELPPDGPPEV